MVPGLKFWDMCAGEALIQSMMGVVCDANHKPLIYDHTLEDYTVNEGIVVAKNKIVFDVANERLIQNTGYDLPYYREKAHEETRKYREEKALKAQQQQQ